MLFDTDVVIWSLRGNKKAAAFLDLFETKRISVITYMELAQGARNKDELKAIKSFLEETGFYIVPLTENIGHRASIYVEQYSLKSGLLMADALIAATAAESAISLATANVKHFKDITDIDVRAFHP